MVKILSIAVVFIIFLFIYYTVIQGLKGIKKQCEAFLEFASKKNFLIKHEEVELARLVQETPITHNKIASGLETKYIFSVNEDLIGISGKTGIAGQTRMTRYFNGIVFPFALGNSDEFALDAIHPLDAKVNEYNIVSELGLNEDKYKGYYFRKYLDSTTDEAIVKVAELIADSTKLPVNAYYSNETLFLFFKTYSDYVTLEDMNRIYELAVRLSSTTQ